MKNSIKQLTLNAAAVAAALSLSAFAVGTGVAQHVEPAARFVVAECQGFDALASAGSNRVSCDAPRGAEANDAASDVAPSAGVVPVAARSRI